MIASFERYEGPAGPDTAALTIGPAQCPAELNSCFINGGTSDWGLKMSRPYGAIFRRCTFTGGLKRAVDVVRGGELVFRDCFFGDGGQRPTTKSRFSLSRCCDVGLKAGVRDVTFENCVLNDILLGDYSIYDQIDRPKTRRIKLINCRSWSGLPIIVRGRHAEPVLTENTQVAELVWPAWLTSAYWDYNRRFGDRRVIAPDQFILDPRELV